MNFKKVYLVDDNPTTLFLHKDVVSDVLPNSEILSFEDSDQFLKAMFSDDHFFDEPILLLLDINMPQKTGYDVLEEIEETVDELENLNVIMVTSSNLRRDIERSSRFPCIIGYLEKPITVNNLKTALIGGY